MSLQNSIPYATEDRIASLVPVRLGPSIAGGRWFEVAAMFAAFAEALGLLDDNWQPDLEPQRRNDLWRLAITRIREGRRDPEVPWPENEDANLQGELRANPDGRSCAVRAWCPGCGATHYGGFPG